MRRGRRKGVRGSEHPTKGIKLPNMGLFCEPLDCRYDPIRISIGTSPGYSDG